MDYSESLELGELIGLRCSLCMKKVLPPVSTCPDCGNDKFKKIKLEGEGDIVGYSTIEEPISEFEVPHVSCVVMLEEGMELTGRLDCSLKAAKEEDLSGRRVRLSGFVSWEEIETGTSKLRICPMFHLKETYEEI